MELEDVCQPFRVIIACSGPREMHPLDATRQSLLRLGSPAVVPVFLSRLLAFLSGSPCLAAELAALRPTERAAGRHPAGWLAIGRHSREAFGLFAQLDQRHLRNRELPALLVELPELLRPEPQG